MKSLKFLFVFALMAMSVLVAKAQNANNIAGSIFFKAKYTRDKVWDVQRSPAYPVMGQPWTLSGLKDAFDATGNTIDWGVGRYLMFAAEVDNSKGPNSMVDDVNNTGTKYFISLKLFEKNGTLVKVVSKWGRVYGVGGKGFMYEEEGFYGTFFSFNIVKETSITYKPIVAEIKKLSFIIKSSDLIKGTDVVKDAPPVKETPIVKTITDAPLFGIKYTKDKVWDVQRSPAYPVAGQAWTLSGLSNALSFGGTPVDWSNGRYLMFVAQPDNANAASSLVDDVYKNGTKYIVSLKLFETNGRLVQDVSRWGKIIGLGDQGFMYEVEGMYGTFFSPTSVNASTVVTYKPTLSSVTKLSQLSKVGEAPKVIVAPVQTNIATGFYTLTAKCSGLQLDVLDASRSDGATLQQWRLNGNVAQHWKIEPVAGAPGYYTLTARCSGKLLDVLDASNLDGATVQQWSLNGNTAQHWKIEAVAGSPSYYTFTARCSGKNLEVAGGSKAGGAKIQQWTPNGNISQQWKLDMVQ